MLHSAISGFAHKTRLVNPLVAYRRRCIDPDDSLTRKRRGESEFRIAAIVEETEEVFLGDGHHEARSGKAFLKERAFCYGADFCDPAKVEGDCFLASHDAVVREGVLVGVSGGVVGLADGAEDARDGGEVDEEV